MATTSSRSELKRARYDVKDLDTVLGLGIALTCLAAVLTCVHVPQQPAKKAAPSTRNSTSRIDASAPTPSVTAATTPAALALARPPHKSLDGFREALKQIQVKRLEQPLRVLWLGDSHTAGVTWPSTVEQILIKQAPSGGPGFLPLGLPNQRQHGAKISSDPGFDIAPHPPAKRSPEDDGVFGLAGFRATSHDRALEVVVKIDAKAGQGDLDCQLMYRYQRPNDRLVVSFSGKQFEVPEDSPVTFPHGLRIFRFKLPTQALLQVRILHGSPELFGMIAETSNPGIVIDVLGINGARFATPLAWDEESWKALVSFRHPALAVVAYGTNEVFDEVNPDRYESDIVRLLARLRAAVADVECLLAGPTDVGRGGRSAQDRVRAIDEMERRVAEHQGCAYFSPYQTMGGDSSFEEWLHATPALATPDRIHLTPAGYGRLGEQMGELLVNGLP